MKKILAVLFISIMSLTTITGCSSDFLKKEEAKEITRKEDTKEETKTEVAIDIANDTSKSDVIVHTYDGSSEQEKYLDDLASNIEAPVEVTINNYSSSTRYVSGMYYTLAYNSAIIELSKVKDYANYNRYQIFTKSRVWVDDASIYLESKNSIYGCGDDLINEGDICSIFEDAFDDDSNNPMNMFRDSYGMYDDENGNTYHAFDSNGHEIGIQVKYVIVDTMSGKVYESDYSKPSYYGKDQENSVKVASINDAPKLREYGKRYTMDYNEDVIYPYFVVRLESSEEVRSYSYSSKGSIYIRFDAKRKDGTWEYVGGYDYRYYQGDDYICIYMPLENSKVTKVYDENNLPIRIRYEYHDNGCYPDSDEPSSASEWAYFNLTF